MYNGGNDERSSWTVEDYMANAPDNLDLEVGDAEQAYSIVEQARRGLPDATEMKAEPGVLAGTALYIVAGDSDSYEDDETALEDVSSYVGCEKDTILRPRGRILELAEKGKKSTPETSESDQDTIFGSYKGDPSSIEEGLYEIFKRLPKLRYNVLQDAHNKLESAYEKLQPGEELSGELQYIAASALRPLTDKYTQEELASVAGCSQNRISVNKTRIEELLQSDMPGPHKSMFPFAEQRLYRIFERLDSNLGYGWLEEACDLLDSARSNLQPGEDLPGTPRSCAASVTYLLTEDYTQEELASVAGCSQAPISENKIRIEELAETKQDDINSSPKPDLHFVDEDLYEIF